MLLVRHNISRPPFDDYNAMSLKDIDDIAMFVNDPHIQAFDKKDICEDLEKMLKEGNPVRCSTSTRTHETYEIACSALGIISNNPVIDERLKEIWFRPSGFVQANELPLDAIRKRLYDCLLEGSMDTEPFHDLLSRVNHLLDDPDLKNTICFTHGFLMRFIKAYIEVDRKLESLPSALKNTPPIGYLGCFHAN